MSPYCKISMDHVDGRIDKMLVPTELGCLDFAMEQFLDGCHYIKLTHENLDWEWYDLTSETAVEDHRERNQE